MKHLRNLVLLVGVSCCLATIGLRAEAQIDVRFTEVPAYSSSPCAKGRGKEFSYQKPPSNADAGYKALFGVWCAVGGDNNEFLLAISHDGDAFPGKKAHPVQANVVTSNGLDNGFGVAFFDTRQKRWAVVMRKGETWVFWPEAKGRLGQARGKNAGKTIRMHKGKKQLWVLLNRVK